MRNLFFPLSILFLAACGGGSGKGPKGQKMEVPESVTDSLKNAEIPEIDSVLLGKDMLDTTVFQQSAETKTTTKNGVRIEFLERSENGQPIVSGEMVKLKYKGKLPDGKVFDSSDMLGMALPYFVGVKLSVKGWDEALLKMKTGDKVRMVVPSKMAYGKKGYGKLIPPNTDLTFEMEVLEKIEPKVTSSGLKFFKTLEKSGEMAKDGQTVVIHFYGWLQSNGEQFDSSHLNGKPYEFILGKGRSLPCWDEAIRMMRKGEKAFIVSPPELAYGANGIPELVPPNATLIYNLELMEIK
jgi:FKBP-type peptidyl-prolyl cis-trans isomerase